MKHTIFYLFAFAFFFSCSAQTVTTKTNSTQQSLNETSKPKLVVKPFLERSKLLVSSKKVSGLSAFSREANTSRLSNRSQSDSRTSM